MCKRLPVDHIVRSLLQLIATTDPMTWDHLHDAIKEMVLGQDLSSREVLIVVQLASTGAEDGPPLGKVFELLGRDRLVERLRGLSLRCEPCDD